MIAEKKSGLQNFIFDHWKLPAMMIGFGLVVLSVRHVFHSKLVNYLTDSAFDVYLIHYQSAIYRLWVGWFLLKELYSSVHPILCGIMVIGAVFLVCLALDLIRWVLFRLTLDRRRGRGFERLYSWLTSKLSRFPKPHQPARNDAE